MDVERRIALSSAALYIGISLALSVTFWGVATAIGGFNLVARFGGAAWVLLLSLIITMPLVTSYVKRRLKA